MTTVQAKGKVERPYRWLQDRIVRTCALEKLITLEEIRTVLREEVDRCNNRQVHSTTGEIPGLRFANAITGGNSLSTLDAKNSLSRFAQDNIAFLAGKTNVGFWFTDRFYPVFL